jgi:hypothetical protein
MYTQAYYIVNEYVVTGLGVCILLQWLGKQIMQPGIF